MGAQMWSDKVPMLAARPHWDGPFDGPAQEAYQRLRGEGLTGERGTRGIPELLTA